MSGGADGAGLCEFLTSAASAPRRARAMALCFVRTGSGLTSWIRESERQVRSLDVGAGGDLRSSEGSVCRVLRPGADDHRQPVHPTAGARAGRSIDRGAWCRARRRRGVSWRRVMASRGVGLEVDRGSAMRGAVEPRGLGVSWRARSTGRGSRGLVRRQGDKGSQEFRLRTGALRP